jgi:hypothetical protein
MKSLYHSLLRYSLSGRHSESFFQLSIEQWRVRVQGSVVPDVIGLESSAKAAEMRLIHLSCALVENDQCCARDARDARCGRQRR